MAWPADWLDGEIVTVARMTAWMNAIKNWGGDVNTGGYALIVENTAPVDGEIPLLGVVCWIDQAANQLKFRVKYSNGTLRTGSVNLT